MRNDDPAKYVHAVKIAFCPEKFSPACFRIFFHSDIIAYLALGIFAHKNGGTGWDRTTDLGLMSPTL